MKKRYFLVYMKIKDRYCTYSTIVPTITENGDYINKKTFESKIIKDECCFEANIENIMEINEKDYKYFIE